MDINELLRILMEGSRGTPVPTRQPRPTMAGDPLGRPMLGDMVRGALPTATPFPMSSPAATGTPIPTAVGTPSVATPTGAMPMLSEYGPPNIPPAPSATPSPMDIMGLMSAASGLGVAPPMSSAPTIGSGTVQSAMTPDEMVAAQGYSDASIPQAPPTQSAPQSAPQSSGNGGITINVGGGGATREPEGAFAESRTGLSDRSQFNGDSSDLVEDRFMANPLDAIMSALGGSYRRNFLSRQAADEVQGLLPELFGLSGLTGGNPGKFQEFAGKVVGGMVGNRNQAFNIYDVLNNAAQMGASGNAQALEVLGGIGDNAALALMERGWRQKGENPILARSRRNLAAERMQQERVKRLNAGDASTDDTAAWARLLAELAR